MYNKNKKNKISIKRLNSIKELYQQHKDSRALREIRDYLLEYPKDEYGRYLYAQLLCRAGDYDTAKDLFETVSLSEKRNKYSAKVEIAKIYITEGNFKEAEKILKSVIKESPNLEHHAKNVLASLYMDQDRNKEALDVLKKAKNQNDKYKVKLAKVHVLLGHTIEAKKLLEEINTDNLERESFKDLITIHVVMDDYETAKEYIEKLKDIKDVNYYKSLSEKAYIYCKEGKHKEAVDIAQEAIDTKFENKTKEVYLVLGNSYTHLANYDKAKESLKKALDSSRKSVREEAIYRLGKLEQHVKNFEEAKMYYEALIETEEKDFSHGYINLAAIYIKEENYKEAEKIIKRMKKNCPNYNELDYRKVKLIIDKHLGRDLSKVEPLVYTEKQIIDYKEEDALIHIKEHREHNMKFSDNIDIDELFKKTKDLMTEDNLVYGDCFDVYEIDYPNISTFSARLRIVALPNSKEVITMYPQLDHKYNRIKDFEAVKQKEQKLYEERKQKLYSKFYKNKD